MFNRSKFKSAVILSEHSMSDVAKALKINESTLYRKINNEGAFTREEINVLIKFLNIDDPKAIFFADKLA